MNPMMKFYTLVLSYLQAEFEDNHIVTQIVDLAKQVKPSWETTSKTVKFLEQCCNRSSSVKDDTVLYTTTQDFAKAAFRDLTVIKNSEAMELSRKLADATIPTFATGEDIFIWARDIKPRPDGSAVIILHVTDIERFRKLIENHDFVDSSTEDGTLEGVVQIGS